MKAGFSEVDVTPPIGTLKAGWMTYLPVETILDPLYARAAVFESQGTCVGFIALDLLSIRAGMVADIRRRIQERTGVPGRNVMVSATHNHAGPAVHRHLMVKHDETEPDKRYQYYPPDDNVVEMILEKSTQAFCNAYSNMKDASLGFGHAFEFRTSHNRRVIMRDGTVRTHRQFTDPEALCVEGPVDPELAVLAVRSREGEILGCLINYASHPTDHGPDLTVSAGYPGVLCDALKEQGFGTCLYLNGAQGNVHPQNPCLMIKNAMDETGKILAESAEKVLESIEWSEDDWKLGSSSKTLQLPYRQINDEDIAGTVFGAERFVDAGVYDRSIPDVVKEINESKTKSAEVQALHIGNLSFVGIPAEYFVEYSLRLKTRANQRRGYIVGQANGMVGYVPTKEAFARGGYETTFGCHSKMAIEAGDMLLDASLELVRDYAANDI